MLTTYKRVEKILCNWIKEHIKFLGINLVFGWIVYYLFMSQNLVNDIDGIWHMSNFIAGRWEIEDCFVM